ncbi:WG repeat-containing protein [Chitinophaga sp. 212800010-3]|uniref:WG repeat-containing protein n=1 Tax=unclassified Chitinophaga TaxID=2619133 RepID=UPI002DF51781|nr:WG repeat-containing protein [Chitinophaga sp. 212800010-3]
MRNLIIVVVLSIFPFFSAIAQSLKVEGYAGSSNNYITKFKGNYFTVERNDGYAIIDMEGKVVASGIKAPVMGFFRELPFAHGTIFTDEAGNIVLKNVKGQTLGTGKYKEVLPFTTDNTVARVPSAPGTWIVAYIDTTGKEIVRFDVKKYIAIVQPLNKNAAFTFVSLSDFLPFSDGLTPIASRQAEKYGYIDKKLQLIIPVGFKKARPFSEGLAAVQNADGNWGFINTSGKLIIPYTYSRETSRFMSGLARVENKEGLKGFINKDNVVVIPPRYEYATCFYKGYALVRENYDKPACLIDSMGIVVTTFPKNLSYIDNSKPAPGISAGDRPEYPFYVSETLQQLVDEGKGIFQYGTSYGLVDKKGKVILDCKYAYLSDFHNGKMFAHQSSFVNNSTKHEFGILKEDGEWAIQIVPSEF